MISTSAQTNLVNTDKYPLSGQVVYQDGERTYKEAFNIDFDSYAAFFSVDCDFDDFLKEMKAQTRELHGVGEKLQQLVTVCQVSADNTDSKGFIAFGNLLKSTAKWCLNG